MTFVSTLLGHSIWSFVPALIELPTSVLWDWAPTINQGVHKLARRPELSRLIRSEDSITYHLLPSNQKILFHLTKV